MTFRVRTNTALFVLLMLTPIVRASPSKTIFRGACENMFAQNFPGLPDYRGINRFYRPSGLSKEEQKTILEIPLDWSDGKIKSKVNIKDGFSSYSMFRNALSYVLKVAEPPKASNWKSLFEYRYSLLRDLLTQISETPGVQWQAWDYKSKDGSVVFQGKLGEIIVIRRNDGALFRGRGSSDRLIQKGIVFESLTPLK